MYMWYKLATGFRDLLCELLDNLKDWAPSQM